MLSKYLLGYIDAHEGRTSFWSNDAAFLMTIHHELPFGKLCAKSSGQNQLKFNRAAQLKLNELIAAGPTCSVPDFEYIAGAVEARGAFHPSHFTICVHFSHVWFQLEAQLVALGAGKRKGDTFTFYGENAAMLLERIIPFLRRKRARAEEVLAFYHKHHAADVIDRATTAAATTPVPAATCLLAWLERIGMSRRGV